MNLQSGNRDQQRGDDQVVQNRHKNAEEQQGNDDDAAPAQNIDAGGPGDTLHLGLHVAQELEALLLGGLVLRLLSRLLGRLVIGIGSIRFLEQRFLRLLLGFNFLCRRLLADFLASRVGMLTGSGSFSTLGLGFFCHGLP